jgi:hypothetical protein
VWNPGRGGFEVAGDSFGGVGHVVTTREDIMSKIRIAVWLAVVLVVIAGLDAEAQAPGDRPIPPDELAGFLEGAARPRLSPEDFAREVERGALLAAARAVREGKLQERTIEIELPFEVTVLPDPFPPPDPDIFPPFPGPNEVDVCWEVCFSLNCYIDCSRPDIGIDRPIRRRTCEDIWEDFRNATNIYWRLHYARELLREGCLERQELVIDFRPIGRPPG